MEEQQCNSGSELVNDRMRQWGAKAGAKVYSLSHKIPFNGKKKKHYIKDLQFYGLK